MKKQNTPRPKPGKLGPQSPEAFAKLVASSYQARLKEITSLRLYDRGERTIHTPDLTAIMQRI